MESIYIALKLDLSPQSPEGPGWYVLAYMDHEFSIPPTLVTPVSAYEAAEGIQSALQSTEGELPLVTVTELVKSGNIVIRGAIESALQEAQAQVKRIPKLQQQLATLPK